MGATTRPSRRSRAGVYVIELLAAFALGTVFFLALLALLKVVFPDSTGLGEFVQSTANVQRVEPRQTEDLGPIASLVRVKNDVRERPHRSITWSAAEDGEQLLHRHSVQTFASSAATIEFDPANRIELGEKSLIVVRRPKRTHRGNKKRAAILFMNGFLRGRLAGGQGDLELEVLAGGGAVRQRADGSNAEIVLAMDQQTSALSVVSGTAELVWNDETTVVPEGFMVTFDEDTAPGAPKLLPKPPRIHSLEQTTYKYRAVPPRITFTWESEDAEAYRLEVARDPEFRDVVFVEQTSDPIFTHGNLSAGRYFWRVIGSRGPFQSPPSPPGDFEVVRDTAPPRLDVAFPEDVVGTQEYVLRGQTETGCQIVIEGQKVPTDDQNRFEYTLVLSDGYNQIVVQAVDPSGNTTFARKTIIAEIPGS